jgi:voltage-gated potassium channel
VRDLWRDRRVRSVLGLVAVLVLYFVVPIEGTEAPFRLAVDLAVSAMAMVVVGLVTVREFRRMQLGEALKFTGAQLLIVLEIVLVVFSLAYFTLALHGNHEMAGLHTKIDALYFTATTIATVGYGDIHSVGQLARVINTIQLVFDILFLAVFVRLISTAASQRQIRIAQEKEGESGEGNPTQPPPEDTF